MTWVLLRGLMREQRHWGNFTQQFAQAHPHERIITLDFAVMALYISKPAPPA
jgi:hypothetical protein